MIRMNRWMLLSILILIGGSGWIWTSRLPADTAAQASSVEQVEGLSIGQVAPDFSLTTLDGEPFTLSKLRGKPVVLNFWATWCGPCRRELPALQAASERYGDQVAIIGVDQAEAAATVQSYVDSLELTFAIPMDTDNAVGSTYGVRGLPTTYFIDSQGVIRRVWSGEMNSITLAESVVELLE